MRDDEIRRILSDANPWWSSVLSGDSLAWTSTNRLLRDRAKYDLGYRSTVLADVSSIAPDGRLIVLTGPRRIGKSVAIIDAVAALCALPEVDARQIIHVPADGMTARDLRRVITLGRQITRSIDQPNPSTRIWFFDEISGIPGWTGVMKAARDQSEFGDDSVVATGSRWVGAEDVEGNLLAGRAGTSPGQRIRQLMPMTFREYLKATKADLNPPTTVHPALVQVESVKRALDSVQFSVDDYDLAWQEYLVCGGFPRAVFEHHTLGMVSLPYLKDLAAWLRADVDPDAPTDSVPRLLSEISSRMTSTMNMTTTSQALGYPNRPTFEVRVTRLINSHAALRCPQRKEKGDVVVGSQSKLYLTDPILAWLPSRVSPGLPAPDMTQLSEAAIAVALARAVEALEDGRWVAGDTIGYARTDSGHEVDFSPVRVPTASGSEQTVPIESKWVDDGWRAEAKVIEAKYSAGILATKSILDTDHPAWAIPAPLVALLLQ
jgi:predicted AAA+ superfamily ATPase